MSAVTATTGHGGWPMTVFLTPEGEPFFCGTYFPRDHFLRVLAALDEAWRTREDEVRASGTHIATSLAEALQPPTPYAVEPAALSSAVGLLARQFDHVAGGFGGAPKFPPSMVLEFLLRHHARTGDAPSRDMACRTLEAMARSGMYDQLAGGFARYAVDAGWVVPHFEKMLYDNALLLRACTTWWKVTRDPLAERIVRETADFVVRDLGTAAGGFASSLDADAAGVEGLTYAWTPEQLREVLGDDGPVAAELLVRDGGGDVRARRLHAAAADRPGRPRLVRRGAPPAARRPRRASSARTRRQGRHVVERSRDRRTCGCRRCLRPPGLGRGGRPVRRPRPRRPPRRRRAAARVTPRRGRGRPGRRRRPRQPRGGAARAAPGHGRVCAGSTRLARCWTLPATSRPTTAASTTPPGTPSRSTCARAAPPTTPNPPGSPLWQERS